MSIYLHHNFLVHYTDIFDELQYTVFPIIRQNAALLFVRFAQTPTQYRTEQGSDGDFYAVTR